MANPSRAAVALVMLSACAPADAPPAGDADRTTLAFGHPDSVLFWTPEQQLAGFPNYDRIFDVRPISASPTPLRLPAELRDWGDLTYEVDGASYDLESFLEHNRVVGLLVLKDGRIVLEEYRLDHGPERKWVSYSVAKSVVSLLYGAAIRDGFLGGVDDLVTDYLPGLAGSSYEGVTVGHLLQMASGVEWNEDYTDPTADVSLEIGMTNDERLAFYASRPRAAEPGARFNYSTGETHLAGAVLRAAIGGDLAAYLESEIWHPFGMEHDANWRLVEPDGPEHGGCCLSATLRDYARIGLFALRGGSLPSGEEVLVPGWMEASTAPSPTQERYGYLWWLDGDGSYAARGIFGQGIFIDPEERIVIVTHSAWPTPTGSTFSTHRDALAAAIAELLRGTPGR